MFRLEEHMILICLLLIPIGLLLIWWTLKWKRSVLNDHGDPTTFARLYPNWSATREWLKGGLLLSALALLFIAWANPQWGTRTEKVTAKSSDVIIALDISQSMMAEDISPNRMERAKRFCTALVEKLTGDRIGLIFFAGGAYTQMPLSHDYALAQVHLKAANPDQAGTQGTVISEAIALARSILSSDSPSQKAMIIISDGEDHEPQSITEAEAALAEGVHIYTVGIGSEEGATIPVMQGGRKTMKTDSQGNMIRSTLNKDMLTELANAGGGEFYMIDQVMSALSKLDREMERMEKRQTEQRSFTEYNSYFQLFLLPAILLLFIEFMIPNFVDKARNWKSLFGLK